MNRSLRQLAAAIRDFVEQCDHIEGYYEMSRIKDDGDFYYSVGGGIVFLYDCGMTKAVAHQLVSYVRKHVDLTLSQVFDCQNVVFITEDLARFNVELSNFGRIDYHVRNLVDSGVRDFHGSLLIDKDGRLVKEFERLWHKPKDHLQGIFEQLVDSIKFWSYEFRLLSTRLDHFRAYQAYVELYYKFVSFKLLESGNWKHLLSQKYAFYRKLEDNQIVIDLAPQLFIESLLPLYYRLIEEFLASYERVCQDFGFKCDKNLSQYFEALDQKFYPAYNFRDFALVVNQCMERKYLKEGRLYRSGHLDFFPREYVQGLLYKHNIKMIVDLRLDSEIEARKEYQGVEIVNFQVKTDALDFGIELDWRQYRKVKDYIFMIENLGNLLGDIYRTILQGLERGAVMVNCYAGRDRTGIVIALLQMLLKVPEQCIIQDFISSFTSATANDIKYVISFIKRKYERVERWFGQKAGLSDVQIERLRSLLLA